MKIETMSQEEINEIVFEAMSELPEEIQSAIENSNWHAVIRSLVLKYKLRVDQGNLLENHTLFTMIGINKADHLISVIEGFGLDPDQTASLISEIETLVFDNIKDAIMVSMSQEERDKFAEPVLKQGGQGNGSSEDRDSILAEIEKEHELPEMENLMPRGIPHPSAPLDTREPSVGEQPRANNESISAQPEKSFSVEEPLSGGKIAKPFSISSGTDMQVGNPTIASGEIVPTQATPAPKPIAPTQTVPSQPVPTQITPNQIATGIQQDPIHSGLSKPTAMTPEPSIPVAKPQPIRSADPYREPIE